MSNVKGRETASVRHSAGIAYAGVRSRQAELAAVLAHCKLLMGEDLKIRTRASRAQENESGGSILRKIGNRVTGIEIALRQQASGASKTSPLMADRWKLNALGVRRVPDVLVLAHGELLSGAARQVQNYAMTICGH